MNSRSGRMPWRWPHSPRPDLEFIGEASRLPAAVESAIYRIVQEALTNVLKHAVEADADGGRPRVLQHIGERLLHDPVDRALDGRRQARGLAARSGATSTAPPSTCARPPSTTWACARRWRRSWAVAPDLAGEPLQPRNLPFGLGRGPVRGEHPFKPLEARAAIDLRPTALDDLGLREALATLLGEWGQRHGIRPFGLGRGPVRGEHPFKPLEAERQPGHRLPDLVVQR
jgi:hypothetical protein